MTNREYMHEKRRVKRDKAAAASKPKPKSKRLQRLEAKMVKYLEENGWVQSERNPDGWIICMFDQYNEVYRTLHQAYKTQWRISHKKNEDEDEG